MKHMVKASKTHTQKKQQGLPTSRVAGLFLAGYFLVILLLQLFTFEQFPELLSSIGLIGVWSGAAAITLVVVELLALPYLIGLKMSRGLRRVSGASVLVGLVLLSILEVMAFIAGRTVFMGATLDLPGGVWSLSLLAALWILAFWAVWGGKISRVR